jgi:hypothetical protein
MRAVLALTDTATAARYGLATASLQNAAGHFVAPDNQGLLAAQAAMKPSGVSGVLSPDPSTKSRDAYPLTLLTYGATVPEKLTKKEGQDYAALLRYAVGNGQRPGVSEGTLPAGYAPLPAGLRAKTRAAADAIATRAGTKPSTPSTDGGTGGNGTGGTGNNGATGSGSGAGTSGEPSGTPSSAAASPSTSSIPSGSPSTAPAAASGSPLLRTPDWALGAVRYALLIALVTGIAAAICGPVLPTVVPRLAAGVTAWRTRDKTSPKQER